MTAEPGFWLGLGRGEGARRVMRTLFKPPERTLTPPIFVRSQAERPRASPTKIKRRNCAVTAMA
jgi:hypothetical protein